MMPRRLLASRNGFAINSAPQATVSSAQNTRHPKTLNGGTLLMAFQETGLAPQSPYAEIPAMLPRR